MSAIVNLIIDAFTTEPEVTTTQAPTTTTRRTTTKEAGTEPVPTENPTESPSTVFFREGRDYNGIRGHLIFT